MKKAVKIHLYDNVYGVVELTYSKGGLNYFNMRDEQRGYWLIFTVKEIKDNIEKYTPIDKSNFRLFIKGAKRFNRKTFEKLADNIDLQDLAILYKMFLQGDKNMLQKRLNELSLQAAA